MQPLKMQPVLMEKVWGGHRLAAPGGGYILASDHSLHDGIPVENIRRMFPVGAAYGREVYAK